MKSWLRRLWSWRPGRRRRRALAAQWFADLRDGKLDDKQRQPGILGKGGYLVDKDALASVESECPGFSKDLEDRGILHRTNTDD